MFGESLLNPSSLRNRALAITTAGALAAVGFAAESAEATPSAKTPKPECYKTADSQIITDAATKAKLSSATINSLTYVLHASIEQVLKSDLVTAVDCPINTFLKVESEHGVAGVKGVSKDCLLLPDNAAVGNSGNVSLEGAVCINDGTLKSHSASSPSGLVA